ncbi:putative RNA helicase [Helianthus annuus]|nr:putative RNA helicase [Helianthus annuus]KAJ0825199.1 putative RNA helicase [Helianthus annuus]
MEPASLPEESRPQKRSRAEKRKENKKQLQEARRISDETRNRFQQILDDFHKSNDKEYTFDASISNYERAEVHKLWRAMGMKSQSSGAGANRRVTLYKIMAKVKRKPRGSAWTQPGTQTKSDNTEVKSPVMSFAFSEEGKTVLKDFFSFYSPGDRKEDEKIAVTSSENANNTPMRNDDMFCKPRTEKGQVEKKFQSFVARMQSDRNLKQITESRSKLPIASFKDVITSTVESNQVVLISGQTGCGKTTQVPQYLLDYMWSKGEECKIVCTQPRRISAVSVAERIASERGEAIGQSVGYKIKLDTKGGRHSSVVFCTNGVLLRILVHAGNTLAGKEKSAKTVKDAFPDITHIIVDEIHERDRFSDFMLTIIRDILPIYPHLRVVLMSATLDAERFSQYFGGCPIICVPGFTYDVKRFYLEDVLLLVKSESTNARSLVGTSNAKISAKSELPEDYKRALDEAINIAWSSDELEFLLDIIGTMGEGLDVSNYQHSVTGVTPLMVLARKGRVGDICMLLSFGANCHLQDNEGKTALSWAQHAGQKEVSEILEKHLNSTELDTEEEKRLELDTEEEKRLLDRYLKDVNPEVVDIILIEQLLRKICTESEEGAILVFLPGWDEIQKLNDKLLSSNFFNNGNKFLILPLHSMVPSIDQKKVFVRPPHGCRKIVLSTNIAETSVTIDDVVFVIDSGRAKEKSYDPFIRVSTLQTCWISKANAKQREGRAGRCQPGICYHLYSKLRAASLAEFQEPEIKRTPIEELCLQVKLLNPDCKIEDFLKKTLDPPVSLAIHNAITVLQDVGALSPNEELTKFGEKIASIAVHPVTIKMLLFAISMNCLDPALTLACANDFRDPFIFPMSLAGKSEANAAKSKLASVYGGHGDQLAIIAAFECWKNAKERGQEARFCRKYFVAAGGMRMLSAMREQLRRELCMNGFIPKDSSRLSENSQDKGIINAVIVAGLYPRVGRLFLDGRAKRYISDVNEQKVMLGRQSVNSRVTLKKKKVDPLVIYDEVTLGDMGFAIKKCSIIGPLSVLLLATEIAVAPINDDNETVSEDGNKERHEDEFMSNPDTAVEVVADRWLSFKSTALDAAQICCLRERLSDAILFKITHLGKDLPPVLAASVAAIAKVLSCDGLAGISEMIGENGKISGLSTLLNNKVKKRKIYKPKSREYKPWRPSENQHPNCDAPSGSSRKRGREDMA